MYGARASTGNPPREPGAPLRKSRKNSKKTQQLIISLGAGRPAPCHAEIEQTIADHARMKKEYQRKRILEQQNEEEPAYCRARGARSL